MNFVLRGLKGPNNVTNLLMNLALKGSNSSISKSVNRYLYKFNLYNDVFTYYSYAHFRRSMERSHAVDICEDLVTTVHHIISPPVPCPCLLPCVIQWCYPVLCDYGHKLYHVHGTCMVVRDSCRHFPFCQCGMCCL